MSEKNVTNSVLTEETVVAKVAELMETLDHVKKYNALARSFKKFALIVLSSITVFLAFGASLGFLKFSWQRLIALKFFWHQFFCCLFQLPES